MNRLFKLLIGAAIFATPALSHAQSAARQTLDRAAAQITGARQGATARFSTTGGSLGGQSGTIYVKGSKFYAETRNGKIWNDGRTQWTYARSTQEVTVQRASSGSSATANPLGVLTLYRNGYNLSQTVTRGGYTVRMTAANSSKTIKEAVIQLTKSYIPTSVRIRQRSGWTTIKISNFSRKSLSDNTFRFTSNKAPGAEIVDLR